MASFNITPDSFDPDSIGYGDTSGESTKPKHEPSEFEPTVYTPDNGRLRQPQTQPSTRFQPVAEPQPAPQQSPRQHSAEPKPQPKQTPKASPSPTSKPSPKPKNNTDKNPGVIDRIRDWRVRLFIGITLTLATAYLLIVCISYFANTVKDQPLVLNNSLSQLAEKSDYISNAGGPLGAWIGNIVISQWMGLGTFILIIYMARCGLALMGVKRMRFWAVTVQCLLSAIALSVVAGFVTYEMSLPFFWGGRHGHFVNAQLIAFAGHFAALGVSLLLTVLVCLIFYRPLHIAWSYVALRIGQYAARCRSRREAHERERLEAEAEAESRRAQMEMELTADQMQHDNLATNQEDIFSPDTIDANELPDSQIELNQSINYPIEQHNNEDTATLGEMTIEAPEIEQADVIEAPVKPSDINSPYDPRADLSHFQFPSLELLNEVSMRATNIDADEQEQNQNRIISALRDYGIEIQSIKATVGPTVTLYEIVPAKGVPIMKIRRLEDDIALSIAALGIRIIAPIPGKGTIGIEVPNKDPQVVSIRSILGSKAYQECTMELPMAMGCTISNDVFLADLAKMPHLLVAGATGMGKSVGLNTIIASLLYKKHPAELKFVMVDPKMVEFSLYSRLERHYMAKLPEEENPIITDPLKVLATLNSVCIEMDNRYTLLMNAGCREIKAYNKKFINRELNPEKGHRFMPYIVVIVDEFGDLMLTAGKEVEKPISRIAAKARAVGIHMILATQRPSTNVITGVIKANFPGRVAFRVFQMVDSKTILDHPGANQLIGRGDILFSNSGKVERVQCAFIDTPEVEAICQHIDNQVGYESAYLLPEYIPDDVDTGAGSGNIIDRDSLFEEAARFIVSGNTASTSSLQRRYSIGYNRAGKIMDQLERAGIVGPALGSKPRQVLMDVMQLDRILDIETI